MKNQQITKEELYNRNRLWGNYCLANSAGKSEKVAKRKLDLFEHNLFKKYKVNLKTHDIKWGTGWFYKKRINEIISAKHIQENVKN